MQLFAGTSRWAVFGGIFVFAALMAMWFSSAPSSVRKTPPQKSVVEIQNTTSDLDEPTSPKIFFSEISTGRFEVRSSRYKAVVGADDGLIYEPSSATLASPQRIELKFDSALRGEAIIAGRNPHSLPAVSCDGDMASLGWSRDFVERFHARGDGVEQTFLLGSKPAGNGNLELRFSLSHPGLRSLSSENGRPRGIGFLGESGEVLARYGRVVVRESRLGKQQSSLVLDATLSEDGSAVRISVPSAFLESATYPVVIDPLVGTDFKISPNNGVGVGAPTIAAGKNNFLVAWTDYRDGSNLPRIYGSIVSTSGIATNAFPISSNDGLPRNYNPQRVSVAFDGDNWLVAWSDDRQTDAGIRGSLVSSTGIVLGSRDFLIALTTGKTNEAPLVAFNGADFFVAWHDTPSGFSGNSEIFFARVSSGGSVAPRQSLGSDFSTRNQTLHFLAPQRPSGDMLVVFEEFAETPKKYRTTRISQNGEPRDPGGTVLFTEDVTDGGFGKPIGATFVDGGWEVLSTPDQTTDSSVYLHKQSTTGTITPPSGVFAEVGVGPTDTNADKYAAAFAGSLEWLFVRNEKVSNTEYHQLGKRVTFDRIDKDPLLFQIDTSTKGVLLNAIAAQAGSHFLVVWTDGREGVSQPSSHLSIFGAIVDATFSGDAGTPLVAKIDASPLSGEPDLLVSFDSSASSSAADSLEWNLAMARNRPQQRSNTPTKAQAPILSRLHSPLAHTTSMIRLSSMWARIAATCR